jgi:hypothetical protein
LLKVSLQGIGWRDNKRGELVSGLLLADSIMSGSVFACFIVDAWGNNHAAARLPLSGGNGFPAYDFCTELHIPSIIYCFHVITGITLP